MAEALFISTFFMFESQTNYSRFLSFSFVSFTLFAKSSFVAQFGARGSFVKFVSDCNLFHLFFHLIHGGT